MHRGIPGARPNNGRRSRHVRKSGCLKIGVSTGRFLDGPERIVPDKYIPRRLPIVVGEVPVYYAKRFGAYRSNLPVNKSK